MHKKKPFRGKGINEDEALKEKNDYQCSGNMQMDFPALCAFLDTKGILTIFTTETKGDTDDAQSQINDQSLWSKPCLIVKLENDDPQSVTGIKISGWRVNEQIFQVVQKTLPSMSQLESLQFWQAGLTDPMVISLVNMLSLCSTLRSVTLEGNALPEQSFHLLLSEDSHLTHLSLRNNRIGDEGARLIGLALSTTRSANKNLSSLNLAFNSIGDAGARHVAQGLRFNRTLLFLSLSNNHIGDLGAAHLAMVLGEFALTHEEIKERRKMLLQRALAESSRKDKKAAENKEEFNKKSTDIKETPLKDRKQGGKEKELPTQEAELVEIVNPLLDPLIQCRDGEVFLPGNKKLVSFNLAGNRIKEKSLPLFLKSLEQQHEGGGLLRLCLQRNAFSSECDTYIKIKEVMATRAPFSTASSQSGVTAWGN